MRNLIFLCIFSILLPPVSMAETSECAYPQELDRYRLLRRLSMDLRLQSPSYEEYLALDGQNDVPESIIDGYLDSEAFRISARRFHEDLFWPAVTNVSIADVAVVLAPGKQGALYSVLGASRRKMWRKGSGSEICGNWKQEEFNSDGSPIPKIIENDNGGLLYLQDGYVEVEPYWAPGTTVKVCAFDAQTAEVGLKGPCNILRSKTDPKCGCGPNLRACYSAGTSPFSNDGVVPTILRSLREQLLLVVDDYTSGGEAYSQLLTTKRTYWNGAIAHWKKYLAQMTNLNKTYNALDSSEAALPEEIVFTDTNWQKSERADPHAGVVTLPAFTLRFQTNRGRANRFRVAFTSQYFVPPADPNDIGCDPLAEDLTQRCVCRKCHQVLEPLAAYFGGVSEAGSSLIADEELFPHYSEICDPTKNPKPPINCGRFYVTSPGSHNPGSLFPYQFADIDDPLHKTIAANLAAGPAAWGKVIIENGQFHSAIIRHLFRHLMGRNLILDPTRDDSELELLTDLTSQFKTHDSFKSMVKTLVMLPQYRRVR
ncbi:MAG TPA: hypothetical protein EYN06_03940 [Myxococcales bacterium]|nr:hypothetical protein [Myxococcales bacterium]